AQNRKQARILPRLLDEVAGGAAHGLHRQVHISPGGHHDHREHAVASLNLGKQVQTLLTGGGVASVVQINQSGVELLLLQRLQNAGGGRDRANLIAFGLEKQAQGFDNVALVVGDQNARRGQAGRGHFGGLTRGLYTFGHCLLHSEGPGRSLAGAAFWSVKSVRGITPGTSGAFWTCPFSASAISIPLWVRVRPVTRSSSTRDFS